MPGPLTVEDENGVTRAANGFALGAVLFLESIDRDDIPRTVIGKIADPLQIWRVAGESVRQMDNRFDLWRYCRQFPDAVGKVRGYIIVEEKFQAASLCSNSTAALTICALMSNTRATISVSPPSA